MTSDAKVGLLLGLVFIFIIAFIINGLPTFRKGAGSNELTNDMINLPANPVGLAAKEREFTNAVRTVENKPVEFQTPFTAEPNIRSIMRLPNSIQVMNAAEESAKIDPTAISPSSPTIAERSDIEKIKPVKPPLPKIYVVADGDNLSDIAKKFYGSQEGNKRVNIARIFEANRRLLKSPDQIYAGQKLIIPPLPTLTSDKDKIGGVFSATAFKRVKYPSTDTRGIGQTRQSGRYVVREGDSLWRIAAEQLGDPSRYPEIVKLNTDILEDENKLHVGMPLKMPLR